VKAKDGIFSIGIAARMPPDAVVVAGTQMAAAAGLQAALTERVRAVLEAPREDRASTAAGS
jgi:hypothetical protein